MTRDEIRAEIRAVCTLAECRQVAQTLRDYLQAHPDDDDLRDEGSSLYMKLTALEQTRSAPMPVMASQTERVA